MDFSRHWNTKKKKKTSERLAVRKNGWTSCSTGGKKKKNLARFATREKKKAAKRRLGAQPEDGEAETFRKKRDRSELRSKKKGGYELTKTQSTGTESETKGAVGKRAKRIKRKSLPEI